MHDFAMVVGGSKEYRDELARVETFISTGLTFVPELAICTSEAGVLVCSFQAQLGAFGVERWSFIDGDDIILVSGFPTFERFSSNIKGVARRRPAEALFSAIQERGFDRLYTDLGGVFSVVWAHKGTVRTTATFSGYGTLHFHGSRDFNVIGSRASLVSSLLPESLQSPNYEAAAWVCSTTMVLGNKPFFNNVDSLLPGSSLSVSSGLAHVSRQEPSFAKPNIDDSFVAKEDRIRKFCERYEYLLDLPIQWQAHITGGKDSRAALAAILSSGKQAAVQKFITNGDSANGDVIVGTQIAQAFGLDSHSVRIGQKRQGLTKMELDTFFEKPRFSAWKYEGQLTSWDGALSGASALPSHVTLMGGGGEIYRQKGKIFPLEFAGQVAMLRNWYWQFDALGILGREWRETLQSRFAELIEEQRNIGVENLQTALYITHRLGNWGAAHFQGNAASSVASLIDLDLARETQRSRNCGDEVHLEIINRCQPALLEFPLVNDRWESMSVPQQEPLITEVRTNFPWQYELAQARWSSLLDWAIDESDVLGGVVDKSRLIELRTKGPVLSSAPLKMLYGVLTTASLFGRQFNRKLDFYGSVDASTVEGTYSDELRSWLDSAHMRFKRNWPVASVDGEIPVYTMPAAPVLNTVKPGDRTVDLAWSLGTNGGSSVLETQALVYDSETGGTLIRFCSIPTPTSSSINCTIQGLNINTTYWVTVRAKNTQGWSTSPTRQSFTTSNKSEIRVSAS